VTTLIDLFFRIAYRNAYQLMRVYWALRHPSVHGALVAIWHGGKILLVQNSYVPYRSLPGGYVGRGESGRDAVIRELREETGVIAKAADLKPVIDEHHDWEGKREHIEIFELDVTDPPRIRVDNREVVDASFFSPEEALRLKLFPPLRRVIERRLGTPDGAVSRAN
jgi:ADP-ribose pyrophosphatase YjhB (NUDIX family)